MFDIHCHILPGIDDGAELIDDTLKMAEIAVKGRCSAVICTPHFNEDSDYEYKMLPMVVKKLEELLLRHRIRLSVYAGQEILLNGRNVEMLISGELLTLNGSAYPLVEFDFGESYSNAKRRLERLVEVGFVPVLAHPERYEFISAPRAYELRCMGCVLQINKGSYSGAFGERAMNYAHELTNEGLADVVASDAHGPYRRTPYLADIHEYISTEWSIGYADLLLKHNPYRIINNRRIIRYSGEISGG